MDLHTLAARALNSSRTVHKPTYAGLRLLLASVGVGEAAIAAFLERACKTRDTWRYFSFQSMKEASPPHRPVYRNCVTGSPLTSLAEAYILRKMSAEPAFQPPDCSYSYLWPRTLQSGRNFEYFFDGYERRRRRVGELLAEHRGYVAVVSDIKSFYPSVNKDVLRGRIGERANKVEDPAAEQSIRHFLLGLVSLKTAKGSDVPGIPIGPDAAHVLGHIALDKVDARMSDTYQGRYLRYVDDVVIVCPPSEVRAAQERLHNWLGEEGLELNIDKQDEVRAEVWAQESVMGTSEFGSDTFESLLQDISYYLLGGEARADSLRARLRSEGLSLPIARMRSLSKSQRYRSYVRLMMSSFRGWLRGFRNLFATENSIVSKALAVRKALWNYTDRLSDERPPNQPMRRRWYAQKRRYAFNRLLYLSAPTDYQLLTQLIPEMDELQENKLVIAALSSGDATQLLKCPGRVRVLSNMA